MNLHTILALFFLGLSFVSCDNNEPKTHLLKDGQIEFEAYPNNNNNIGFSAQAEKIIIDWGDGTIEELIPNGTYFDSFNHFYSDTKLKTVLITTEKMTYFSLKVGLKLKFGNCPDLKNVFCPSLPNKKGHLSVLDVTKLEFLEELYCYNNQLTSLDLSKNAALTILECRQNELKNLDTSNNTALVHLDCDNNQLTYLDVNKNTALGLLNCSNNLIKNIDTSKNLLLYGLHCYNNHLSSIYLSQNTALSSLDVSKNQLTNLNVENNVILKYIGCADNQLTSLDLNKNSVLIELDCSNNQLTAQSLNYLFESLPIITDTSFGGMLSIGGNIGTNDCNRIIAINKWWTLYDK